MISRALTIAAALCICATSANALTMKECSAKYKAAQTAGTLNGQKWQDFRKAECGSDAAATPAAAPSAPKAATTPTAAPARPTAASAAKPTVEKPVAAPAPVGDAMFPNAVSPKYSSESAGKARMHTCLDQYNANKSTNGNGGLKWIVKGGGYYSECNKRLKG
jgi:hypothetical protein